MKVYSIFDEDLGHPEVSKASSFCVWCRDPDRQFFALPDMFQAGRYCFIDQRPIWVCICFEGTNELQLLNFRSILKRNSARIFLQEL